MATPDNLVRGKPLVSSAGVAEDFGNTVITLVRKMHEETEKRLRQLLEHPGYAMDAALPESGNPAARARIILNEVRDKYTPLFRKWGARAVKRMVTRTLTHSQRSIEASLRDVGEGMKLDASLMNGRIQEIITASSNEAAQLIRSIPEKYLADVGGATMRSITGGQGLKELVPYMQHRYPQSIRKARSVAGDQTRKVFQAVNAERCQSLGIQEFEWVHSGRRGDHARKLHAARPDQVVDGHKGLNGGIFRYDTPPYIGEMYGRPVYGRPGDLPECHCFARPVIFKSKESPNGRSNQSRPGQR